MLLIHYSQTPSVCPLLPEHQLPQLSGNPENASGMQVLSDLSERLAYPILVATTAEKMMNYRELLSWGTTASWAKQGPNTAYGHMRELIESTIISGTMDELSESDNSLIVSSIFQAIEHLYNIRTLEDGNEDFLAMHKRVAGLTPQISSNKFVNNILFPRNNAIHTGRISSKALEKFIIATFDFLEGIGYFAEEVSRTKHDITKGSYIQEKGYRTQDLIHLKNDEIKLEDDCTSITFRSSRVEAAGYYMHMEDIIVGTQIRHTILQERNAKGVISYYGQNVELI